MSIDVHYRRSSDSTAKLFIKIDRSGSGPTQTRSTQHTAAHKTGDIVTRNENSKDGRQWRWNIHKYAQNIFINWQIISKRIYVCQNDSLLKRKCTNRIQLFFCCKYCFVVYCVHVTSNLKANQADTARMLTPISFPLYVASNGTKK